MNTCCTAECQGRAVSDRPKVVWKVGEKSYCNICFLNDLEAGKFEINARITRLFPEDEDLYTDTRPQKRRPRTPSKPHRVMVHA